MLPLLHLLDSFILSYTHLQAQSHIVLIAAML
jgi:hypothetical protein